MIRIIRKQCLCTRPSNKKYKNQSLSIRKKCKIQKVMSKNNIQMIKTCQLLRLTTKKLFNQKKKYRKSINTYKIRTRWLKVKKIWIIKARQALKMFLKMIQMSKMSIKKINKTRENLIIMKMMKDFSRSHKNMRIYQT